MAKAKKVTPDDATTAWARSVRDGKIVAGELVRHAAERHLRDLKDGRARGLVWDLKSATRAVEFFPSVLTITAGAAAGKRFDPLPWHLFVLGNLFGWRKTSGRLRYRRAWLETGKGQAKSPLMAAIGLYLMGWYKIPRAEVYAIGQDRATANVLFRDAVAMCRAPIPHSDPEDDETLETRGDVLIRGEGDNAWKIEHPETGSKFQALANGEAISGPRPVGVLADEIHEFKSAHPIETWQRAIAKMAADAMMILGTNTPATTQIVGTSYSESFQRIVKNEIVDDEAFAFIARVDEEDREDIFENEDNWIKALPALDITFPRENIRGEVVTAKTLISTALSVKRLYFGIPIGTTGFWISEIAWRAVQGKVDPAKLRGRRCHLSLDLSQKNDLTALSAAWEGDDEDEAIEVATDYWTTKEGLADRSKADNTPWDLWVAEGHVTAVDGAVIDKTFVAARVAEYVAEHNVVELAFDPYGMADFTRACEEIGLAVWLYRGPDEPEGDGLKLVSHAQGTRVMFEERQLCMPRSIERLEDRVLTGRIVIDSSPVTTACAANAQLVVDGQKNRAFDKKKSRGRIDGLVTIAMAVGAATAHEVEGPISAYEILGEEREAAAAAKAKAKAEAVAANVSAGDDADEGAGIIAGGDADADAIDYAALGDPAHPMFREMAARFEAKMIAEDDASEF
jgi:phage terminase large subunit-like protein